MRVDWQTVKHHFFTRAFLLFLVVGQSHFKGDLAAGADGLTRIQIVLADVDRLTAGRARDLIIRLAGDIGVVVLVVLVLGVVCALRVLFFVGIVVLIEVGFQILQLLAEVVDLVVSLCDILVDAVHCLCHLAQQLAHGLDDFAFLGALVDAETLDQAFQVSSLFLQFHTNASYQNHGSGRAAAGGWQKASRLCRTAQL